MFSLETSRGAGGVMAALANLLLLGKEGFQTLIGHAVEMEEILREEKRLPISTVVLTSQRVPTSEALFTVKQKIPFTLANPLVSDGVKLVPNVTRAFSANQPIFLFLQAYQREAAAMRPLYGKLPPQRLRRADRRPQVPRSLRTSTKTGCSPSSPTFSKPTARRPISRRPRREKTTSTGWDSP
jgi:hypothetical protein